MRAPACALAALALWTAPAAGQGCLGTPVPEGGQAAVALVGTSSYGLTPSVDATDLGIGYRRNLPGPLDLGAGYVYRSAGDANVPVHVLLAGAAWRLFPRLLSLPLAVCARAGVGAALVSDGASDTKYTNLSAPVGVVLEIPVPLGARSALVPYVFPQAVFSRTTGHTFGLSLDASDTGFGVEAGVGLRAGRVVAGVAYNSASLSDALGTPVVPENAVTARLGITF